MSTLTLHWRLGNGERITAQAATQAYLDRPVTYGKRTVGVVRRAQPVDGGRAVRLTCEITAAWPTPDLSKFSVAERA